jgi:ABC-type uncharacterized transport system involved in gliding motility auxiliary subunit
MKSDSRRFAPLGLVLSAFALLTFIILLLVRGLASAGIFQPPDPLLLERATWISLSVIALGFALTAFIDPDRTRRFFLGRQVRNGSNAIIMLLAFLGILVFINLLAYQNPVSWDISESQKNTLSPETITLLESLPQAISARAYYTSSTNSTEVRRLFENFKQHSNGKFSYEFINPETNPIAAQQDVIDRDGTTVLQLGSSPLTERVAQADEEGLATTMVKLLNPEKRIIYFVTGHGEADIEQSSSTAFTLIKRALENKNYTVKPLTLGSAGSIPADANALVIAGPKIQIPEEEVKVLSTYLDNGGAMVIMEDPAVMTKYGDAPDPLAKLIADWGVTLQNDIIFDPRATPPTLVYADPLSYAQHPITEKLRSINSVFYWTQSLLPAETPPAGINLTPLVSTHDYAWGETDMASVQSGKVSYDETKDLAGPMVLAVAAENPAKKARLVIFGNSQFAADEQYSRGYGDILLNAIDWTANQEKLINISPRNSAQRTYNSPGNLGLIGMIITSICLIPLLVIFGGIITWISRRRRG